MMALDQEASDRTFRRGHVLNTSPYGLYRSIDVAAHGLDIPTYLPSFPMQAQHSRN